MSGSPSDFIRRITPASELRRISGSVNSGRSPRSSSAYRRTHTPSRTRPHRPFRWRALACETGSICRRWTPRPGLQRLTRARPLSTTLTMPGMVSEVSATFVARMMRRRGPGWKTRCWSARPRRAKSGKISVFRYFRPSSASAQSRISLSPGRKTSTSPEGSTSVSQSTARGTWRLSSSSSSGGRKNSSTGKVRPSAWITGASPKKAENAPASSVAEEITSFRSLRRSSSRFR